MTISPENPLGLNKNDAAGLDDVIVEGGELHLPIGKPVKILLRSTMSCMTSTCRSSGPRWT